MTEKAKNLTDFYNVFRLDALTSENFNFYQETAAARTGNSYEFHMDLYNRIISATSNVRLLVAGHGGCGKSTEFNKLSSKLEEDSYAVTIINAILDLDIYSFSYVDIIVLIALKLIEYAEDMEIKPSKYLIHAFEEAFSTTINSSVVDKTAEMKAKSEAHVEVGFAKIISIVSNLSASLKMSAGTKTEIRREITPRISNIIDTTNTLLNDINEKLTSKSGQNKKMIIIVDGLEKCSLDLVKNMFLDGSPALAMLDINLVMSCPIGFHRSADFVPTLSYFKDVITMPMIKTHHPVEIATEQPIEYEEGIEILKQLVLKRVDNDFFEENVLREIILKTGGSLRDLSYALCNIALDTKMQNKEKLSMALTEKFFRRESADVFMRIEPHNYKCLKKIYNRTYTPRNDEEYARLLYGSAVFEYNGERWCDLNPLVRDYIDRKGIEILDE